MKTCVLCVCFCSVYQVFVVPLDGTVVFDCASRGSPDFLSAGAGPSSGQYVTGQFPVRHMRGQEMNFTLGDGRYHGGFFNAPLTRGRNYYVILRVVSRWKEVSAKDSSCMGLRNVLFIYLFINF